MDVVSFLGIYVSNFRYSVVQNHFVIIGPSGYAELGFGKYVKCTVLFDIYFSGHTPPAPCWAAVC